MLASPAAGNYADGGQFTIAFYFSRSDCFVPGDEYSVLALHLGMCIGSSRHRAHSALVFEQAHGRRCMHTRASTNRTSSASLCTTATATPR